MNDMLDGWNFCSYGPCYLKCFIHFTNPQCLLSHYPGTRPACSWRGNHGGGDSNSKKGCCTAVAFMRDVHRSWCYNREEMLEVLIFARKQKAHTTYSLCHELWNQHPEGMQMWRGDTVRLMETYTSTCKGSVLIARTIVQNNHVSTQHQMSKIYLNLWRDVNRVSLPGLQR